MLRHQDAAAARRDVVVSAKTAPRRLLCGTQVFRVGDSGLRWRATRCLNCGLSATLLDDLWWRSCAQEHRGRAITWFYALLGLAVVLSSRIWAACWMPARAAGCAGLLNNLLGVATVLPALTGSGR